MPNHSGYGNLSQHGQRVNVDHFSMVPRADIPRSTFKTEHTHKTTFQGGYLIPILLTEVLPGDSIHGTMTVFARMGTTIFPIMDHITLESFFFFVPNRILWTNWVKMMGEQANPGDSISYTLPASTTPTSGNLPCSIYDYMGVPGAGQVAAGTSKGINALPLRAYARIWNEWFRDENLQNSIPSPTDNGPDINLYNLMRRNKRHDYFTSALPWPVKGGQGVTLPLGTQAPIKGIAYSTTTSVNSGGPTVIETGGGTTAYANYYTNTTPANAVFFNAAGSGAGQAPVIYADLSQATGATINSLRLAVQTQRLLERDARSGTRYTELLHAHFGVTPQDARLQRPEYIGGGRSAVQTTAIPQTSGTGASGTTSALAALGGASTATGQHRFSYQATEHGYILGLLHADAELTYQQGIHRLWTRSTRYDFYWPVFAHLGEQAVRNDEIYTLGDSNDALTFGYQERWAEYRHRPSRISGLFRSRSSGTIDPWHSAQNFASLPLLNDTFIQSNPPFARNLAAGSAADNMQFLADMLFNISETRAMPMYSVPGGMDRF